MISLELEAIDNLATDEGSHYMWYVLIPCIILLIFSLYFLYTTNIIYTLLYIYLTYTSNDLVNLNLNYM